MHFWKHRMYQDRKGHHFFVCFFGCSKRSCRSASEISRSVMFNSLPPHELQHTRPPCPSPTPGVHSNSRPSSQWCHPAISSSVVPFSSCPQSLPASDSFPMSQLFAWGGQSTGVLIIRKLQINTILSTRSHPLGFLYIFFKCWLIIIKN